jgi:hypothetical protein
MRFRRAALALLLTLPLAPAFGQESAPTPNLDKIKFSAYVLADVFYSFNITNYMEGQQGSGNRGYFQPFDDVLQLGIAELGVTARQGLAAAHISLIHGTAPNLLAFPASNLWEGYVSYKPADWELKAGVLAPFLGFEKLETTENWNQSRSLAYTYVTPRNNLGISAKVSPSEEFSAAFYIWTRMDVTPPHHGKTYGILLQGRPEPEVILTLGGHAGPAYAVGGNPDTFAVLRGEFTALWHVEEKLSLALAADYFSQDPTGLARSEVMVVALYGRYEVQKDWLVAFRLEEFIDVQATTLLYGPFLPAPIPASMEGRAGTVTLEHKLTKNLRTRLEGRFDWALGDGVDYTVGPFAGGQSMQFTATWSAALGF